MKKAYALALLLLMTAMAYAQFPNPYCGPLTFSIAVEPITLVNFAGINKSSSNVVGSPAHENYTTVMGQVTAGQSYPITLKGNTDGDFITALSVFVDWNSDNDFSDFSEQYYIGQIINSTGLDNITLQGNIAVPGFAATDTVRMRVVKIWNNGDPSIMPDACNANNAAYGQAEDYSLSVTAIPQCLTGTRFLDSTFSTNACDGSAVLTINQFTTNKYLDIITIAGNNYRLNSSINTDYLTLSENNGMSAALTATNEIAWTASVSDTVRVYLSASIACNSDTLLRTLKFTCGASCLNGNMFPNTTFMPLCDSVTNNIITNNASTAEYSEVMVATAGEYLFSSSNANDYITLSIDGQTAVAKGPSPLFYRADTTAALRFYVHTDAFCGVDTFKRIKYVQCVEIALPGCISNLSPADDDTLYVSTGTYTFTWDMPSTGGPIESFAINFGLTPTEAIYTFDFPPSNSIQITVTSDDANLKYYWWVVASNVAGEATCTPVVHSFLVLSSPPTSVENNKALKASIYPNPANQKFNIINADEIEYAKILNTLGQTVKIQEVNRQDLAVDISDLVPGVYQVILQSYQGNEKVIKLVKE